MDQYLVNDNLEEQRRDQCEQLQEEREKRKQLTEMYEKEIGYLKHCLEKPQSTVRKPSEELLDYPLEDLHPTVKVVDPNEQDLSAEIDRELGTNP